MPSTKEYRLRVFHAHGNDEITVMNGQWQDFAGATRDQRVVEEGKASFKLFEVAKNTFTVPGGFYRGSFALIITLMRLTACRMRIRQP